MAKLLAIKCSLIILQLVSLSVASVIIIVYYNPWIRILIDGNVADSGDKLAEQFRGIEGEEIVIFIMCLATIIVSVLGVVGAVRGQEHNHCLLNFYMTTLIIFLFITFVALCGTIWELINKLLNKDQVIDYLVDDSQTVPAVGQPVTDTTVVVATVVNSTVSNGPDSRSGVDLINSTNFSTFFNSNSQQPVITSWWYITKSFLFIIVSATIYASSIKLTRKILDSDEHYLAADDDSGRHFNIDNDNEDNIGNHHSTKDSSFTRV
jgi:hypothetical protein